MLRHGMISATSSGTPVSSLSSKGIATGNLIQLRRVLPSRTQLTCTHQPGVRLQGAPVRTAAARKYQDEPFELLVAEGTATTGHTPTETHSFSFTSTSERVGTLVRVSVRVRSDGAWRHRASVRNPALDQHSAVA